ncbi:MAG: exonuclease domain-containing protein [Akkermansiaceae bacterium]
MAKPPVILKDFYYLDHFFEMVSFLRRYFPGLANEREGQLLANIESLERDAQALAVRIFNRKGRILERGSLVYQEICSLDRSLEHLEAAGMIRTLREGDVDEFIGTLTKGRLIDVMDRLGKNLKGCRSLPKAGLVGKVKEECCFEEFQEMGLAGAYVVQRHVEELDFLGFLFFGRLSEGMQAFTMRDLGILKTGRGRSFKPRYGDLDQARAAFFHARLRGEIRKAEGVSLRGMAEEITAWPDEGKERNLLLLGSKLEKQGDPEEALMVFEEAVTHPARERICRMRFAKGERETVRGLLEEIAEDPYSDEELLFAEDFYRLKFQGGTMGALTGMLREAPVIQVDEAYREHPEAAAIRYYRERGQETEMTENHFWMTLFGVLFWEELQEETPNEFDARPTSFLDGTFSTNKREGIEAKLQLVDAGRAQEQVKDVFARSFGELNGLFHWQDSDEELLGRFLAQAPPKAVVTMLKRMIDDFGNNRRGYPDLLQFHGDGVRFLEVKAEGDQIRRHQLAQIQALKSAGIEAGVVRIEWVVDPEQEYVVVDVETTGGRPDYHRVTEIGAVKVRGGEVIETFETLVNPGCRIPWKIVELTGITDEMVQGQPVFGEIAEELDEFIGDAIFVAHNAKFDEGFLRKEFERVGIEFRRPVLCTVVEMRRHFPRLKSYSLKNLCREFGVGLADHHRALCDARATAELLKLINGKRNERAREKDPVVFQ